MKRIIAKFSMGIGLLAMTAVAAFAAVDVIYTNINVPFEFKVGKTAMPAGQYRIEQEFGKQMIYLVNQKTGRRVQIMRDGSSPLTGRATLSFEISADGYALANVF